MDYNVNGQSSEVVIQDLEARAVATAVHSWFEREPYIAAVWQTLPQQDRETVIEKVRADATEKGFMRLDADQWLPHHVNQMYDAGKLPEIENAQRALHAQAQAQEDYGIQTRPMKEVNAYLEQNYGRKLGPNILPAIPAASKTMTLDQAIAEEEARRAEAKKQSRERPDLSGLRGW